MESSGRIYVAIDLKSFYASAECVSRGLDPLTTNLVVADKSRTNKTICLAVSPSLKAYGIGGRARLFEVVKRVGEVNRERTKSAGQNFDGYSCDSVELKNHPTWRLDYIVAPPRMAYYIEVSKKVYEVYLKYIASEDIHVYSIDEVFMDVTDYLWSYRMTAHELAITIIRDILRTTGITATAGIGTNMYLAKIAMDIVAKSMQADSDGVRIAELDEKSYREKLWNFKPLTKFWRIGGGTARRLSLQGIDTMGKIARVSLVNEDLLYNMFGVNAELLIDHAWGWEPCKIKDVKAYRPMSNSFSSGQVLSKAYDYRNAKVVVREMAYQMALGLVEKKMVTDQIVLYVGYDVESLYDPDRRMKYNGPYTRDYYGRITPKHSHGSANLNAYTSSSQMIMQTVEKLFENITNKDLLIRRINLTVNHVMRENEEKIKREPLQLNLFSNYEDQLRKLREKKNSLEKERRMQEAELSIRKKFGKNALLRGFNFDEGATARERNNQIGGHKA